MNAVTPVSDSQALPARKGLPLFAKIILGIVGVILLLFLVMYGVGVASPLQHQMTKSIELPVDRQLAYDTLVDWEHYPQWRSELVGVAAVKDDNGDPRWLEDWKGDQDVELEMTAQEPGRRVELTIHDPSGMYSGTWEFLVAPADSGCMVTITERGTIPNPLVRGIMNCMPGAKAYCLNLFLTGLAKKLGGDPSSIH